MASVSEAIGASGDSGGGLLDGDVEGMRDGERMRRLHELFEMFSVTEDAAGRGDAITAEELSRTLHSALPEARFDDEDVGRMLGVADTDGSGSICFDEFSVLFDGLALADLSLRSLAEAWLKSSDIADPNVIFDTVWRRLRSEGGGDEAAVRFPRELIWLGGAPGSGKGTNTPFIQRERGYTAPPVVTSSLLSSPHALKIKAEGGLVGDMEVWEMLCREMMRPEYENGVIIDGFPRTKTQVELLHLLHDKLHALHFQFHGTPSEAAFPRPRFRVVVLYVDEHESIQRQLQRGRVTTEHNARVAERGEGTPMEVRDTDMSVAAARGRYRTFAEQTLESLNGLRAYFPYNIIDATGSVEQTELIIKSEMGYQSSMELQEATYDAIKHIPTAEDVCLHGRQNLVRRLDNYQDKHRALFNAVIEAIEADFVPQIRRHALSGFAHVRSEALPAEPLAVDMVVDVLADRHFQVVAIENERKKRVAFNISFKQPGLHS